MRFRLRSCLGSRAQPRGLLGAIREQPLPRVILHPRGAGCDFGVGAARGHIPGERPTAPCETRGGGGQVRDARPDFCFFTCTRPGAVLPAAGTTRRRPGSEDAVHTRPQRWPRTVKAQEPVSSKREDVPEGASARFRQVARLCVRSGADRGQQDGLALQQTGSASSCAGAARDPRLPSPGSRALVDTQRWDRLRERCRPCIRGHKIKAQKGKRRNKGLTRRGVKVGICDLGRATTRRRRLLRDLSGQFSVEACSCGEFPASLGPLLSDTGGPWCSCPRGGEPDLEWPLQGGQGQSCSRSVG